MASTKDIEEFEPNLDGAGLAIGIAMARFNVEIGEGLLSACTAALAKHGVARKDILIVTVPGALELPVALQKLASTDQFDALIALGAVIRGETYHFELVSDQSAAGIQQVALDTGVPIANGVLTTEDDGQAEARMSVKGAECATCAIEMANLLRAIDAWNR
jgi:6,7-dimethyl-8-ribityllumazine synthase